MMMILMNYHSFISFRARARQTLYVAPRLSEPNEIANENFVPNIVVYFNNSYYYSRFTNFS